MKNQTLETIKKKYCEISHNQNNYEIGGGLASGKFASIRHEEAKNDYGKLTLGKATQLFKKASGLDIDIVKSIIKYAVPNMEWHHAGLLPKKFGGGMKKTYFLNAQEICNIAGNWNDYLERFKLSVIAKKETNEKKKNLETLKLNYLQLNAIKLERISNRPLFFYLTGREMLGKYGWFDSSDKSYNLPEYFSGWQFENEEKYNEFLRLDYNS